MSTCLFCRTSFNSGRPPRAQLIKTRQNEFNTVCKLLEIPDEQRDIVINQTCDITTESQMYCYSCTKLVTEMTALMTQVEVLKTDITNLESKILQKKENVCELMSKIDEDVVSVRRLVVISEKRLQMQILKKSFTNETERHYQMSSRKSKIKENHDAKREKIRKIILEYMPTEAREIYVDEERDNDHEKDNKKPEQSIPKKKVCEMQSFPTEIKIEVETEEHSDALLDTGLPESFDDDAEFKEEPEFVFALDSQDDIDTTNEMNFRNSPPSSHTVTRFETSCEDSLKEIACKSTKSEPGLLKRSKLKYFGKKGRRKNSKCNDCNKVFLSSYFLNIHLKNYHPENLPATSTVKNSKSKNNISLSNSQTKNAITKRVANASNEKINPKKCDYLRESESDNEIDEDFNDTELGTELSDCNLQDDDNLVDKTFSGPESSNNDELNHSDTADEDKIKRKTKARNDLRKSRNKKANIIEESDDSMQDSSSTTESDDGSDSDWLEEVKKTEDSSICRQLDIKIEKNSPYQDEINLKYENYVGKLDVSDDGIISFKGIKVIMKGGHSYECGVCDSTSTSGWNSEEQNDFRLELSSRHIRRHIIEEHLGGYKCQLCPTDTTKSYKSLTNLFRHINLHQEENEKIECEICGKPYKKHRDNTRTMKEHLWSHKNEEEKAVAIQAGAKPPRQVKKSSRYLCNQCGKSFDSQKVLTTHEETHLTSEERKNLKVLCPICGKMYTKLGLSSHIKYVHEKSNLRRFSCKFCHRHFYTSTLLNIHVRAVHTKERPFSCNVCSKSFSQKTGLKYHMFAHVKEKTFSCKMCSARFQYKNNLARHIKTSHPGYIEDNNID